MATLAVIDEPLSDADRSYGYRFGCEGIVAIPQACEMLGGVSEATLFRRIADDKFRVGREGGRTVICKKSLINYIASLER